MFIVAPKGIMNCVILGSILLLSSKHFRVKGMVAELKIKILTNFSTVQSAFKDESTLMQYRTQSNKLVAFRSKI
jgi:hypothetical protein